MKHFPSDSRGVPTPELTDNSSLADVSMSGVDRDVITSGDSSGTEFMSPMSRFDDSASPRRLAEIFDDQEPEITQEERELTAPVQGWLDSMNSASSRMNEIEVELMELEARRNSASESWSEQKDKLVHTIGVYYIEKVRPLFDAYQEQQNIQIEVNSATAEFSHAVRECEDKKHIVHEAQNTGVSDNQLLELLESYLSAQANRELFEQLSHDRMAEFRAAQSRCQELRRNIGLRTIERAWPWFEAYNRCKMVSESCTDRIRDLRKEMKVLRETYKDAMNELEKISAQVHNLRKYN